MPIAESILWEMLEGEAPDFESVCDYYSLISRSQDRQASLASSLAIIELRAGRAFFGTCPVAIAALMFCKYRRRESSKIENFGTLTRSYFSRIWSQIICWR